MSAQTVTANDLPSIYVASLSDYNNGVLRGVNIAIDDETDADGIQEVVNDMLSRSKFQPAEEWAIHDFDNFGSIRLGESTRWETVLEYARGIREYGDAYTAWVANDSTNIDPDDFKDAYYGEYESVSDYAREYVEQTHGSDWLEEQIGNIANHIDWESYGNDLLMDGWHADAGGGRIHVFSS